MTRAPETSQAPDRRGRIALVEFVEHQSAEASRAFGDEVARVNARSQGRVAWAGQIDQQLIGTGSERYREIWIREFPNRAACTQALAEHAATATDRALLRFGATPWPTRREASCARSSGCGRSGVGALPPSTRSARGGLRSKRSTWGYPGSDPTGRSSPRSKTRRRATRSSW